MLGWLADARRLARGNKAGLTRRQMRAARPRRVAVLRREANQADEADRRAGQGRDLMERPLRGGAGVQAGRVSGPSRARGS